jgi:hypothetical protein
MEPSLVLGPGIPGLEKRIFSRRCSVRSGEVYYSAEEGYLRRDDRCGSLIGEMSSMAVQKKGVRGSK